jgi:hypothetical protein
VSAGQQEPACAFLNVSRPQGPELHQNVSAGQQEPACAVLNVSRPQGPELH